MTPDQVQDLLTMLQGLFAVGLMFVFVIWFTNDPPKK